MLDLTASEKRTLFLVVFILVVSGVYQWLQPHQLIKPAEYYSKSDSIFHRLSKINPLIDKDQSKSDNAAINIGNSLSPNTKGKITTNKDTKIHLLPKSININTASAQQLQKLPRIGPAMSKRIIEYRNKYGYFKSIDDLVKVKGIGKKTLVKLSPYIKVN